ncbi:MAG: acyltransferase [Gammaproteobacteria bacterium]|nr:acyltransferase [Gammaproteobacteria bacterium]NNL99202.1 acyltransferase [Gammaproteobacteria bacterium]
MSGESAFQLGASSNEMEFDTSDEHRTVAVAMVSQARRTVDIASRHLDPALYDNAAFHDAVKALALSGPHCRIRMLISDPGPLLSRGHRLLDLARQLTSYISLRQPGREHRQFNEGWLLVDNIGYVRRKFADRFEGVCDFANARVTSELGDRFDEMWERGQEIPGLRRLHL